MNHNCPYSHGDHVTLNFSPFGRTLGTGDISAALVATSSERTITVFSDSDVLPVSGCPVIVTGDSGTISTHVLRALAGDTGTMIVLANTIINERRRFGRLRTDVAISVADTDGRAVYHGNTKDLSAAGVAARLLRDANDSDFAGRLGQRVFVRISTDIDEIHAIGTVVGVTEATSIRFEVIAETHRSELVKLIAEHSQDG